MALKCTLSVLHVAAGPSSWRLGTSNKTHGSLAMSCTYHVDVLAVHLIHRSKQIKRAKRCQTWHFCAVRPSMYEQRLLRASCPPIGLHWLYGRVLMFSFQRAMNSSIPRTYGSKHDVCVEGRKKTVSKNHENIQTQP